MKRDRIPTVIGIFSIAVYAVFAFSPAHAEAVNGQSINQSVDEPTGEPIVFALIGPESDTLELEVALTLPASTLVAQEGPNPISVSRVKGIEPSAPLAAAAPAFPNAGAVVVLRKGTGNRVVITNGRRGSTSPKWLLLAVIESLSESDIPFELERGEMPLYRLGWVPDDPDIARTAAPDTPSILLEIPGSMTAFLPSLSVRLQTGIPAESDRHYLTFAFGEALFVPGESFLVTLMIAVSGVTFFILFFFSFTYGSKGEQRLRDFFRVWWLPLFFLAANILALYAAQALTRALMAVQFGSPDAWTVIPVRAFGGKLAFAFFFASLIVTVNQLVPFPRESFIYGYIASIVCLANIFLFSSLDFSLSVLFALAFAIAFSLYHLRNPWIQLTGLILLALPFLPYVRALSRADSVAVGPLLDAAFPWNLRIAMFVMPFQLFMTRLTRSARILTAKRGFHVPILPIAALAVGIAYAGYLVLTPPWTPERPLPVTVRQTAGYDGITTETDSAVMNVSFPVISLAGEEIPAEETMPNALIDVTLEPRLALGRLIARVTVQPALPLDRLSLTVSSATGTAVLAASREFERTPSGDRATFIIDTPGTDAITVEFTSPGGEELTLVASARTANNPWGTRIEDSSIQMQYELTASRSFAIAPDGSARELK